MTNLKALDSHHFMLYTTINALDALLTTIGIYGVGATETNPVARPVISTLGVPGLILYKVIGVGLVGFLLSLLPKRTGKIAISVANVIGLLVCANNVWQIKLLVK